MTAVRDLADRLGPLLGKLGSSHDAEVVAAARAMERLLERHGLSLNDLGAALDAQPVERIVYRARDWDASTPPAGFDHWGDLALYLATHAPLSARELRFCRDMTQILDRPGTAPTPKQRAWLEGLWDRMKEEEMAA